MMEYRIACLEPENLVIEVLQGDLAMGGLVEMKLEEQRRGWIRPGIRTLADIREASLGSAKPDEIDRFAEWQVEHNAIQDQGVTAILVGSPLPTAFATLYSTRMRERRRIEIFSTVEKACFWLGVDCSGVERALASAFGSSPSR